MVTGASSNTPASQLFRRAFGRPPTYVARAPGRLELLGNHTDYNEGLVIAAAIDRQVVIAVSPVTTGKIHLVSSAYPEPVVFPFDEVGKEPASAWADYFKAVLHGLRVRGVHFTGFQAAIHSTIPLGAGLSSSAAVEVATALAVRQLHPYSLTSRGLGRAPERDRRGNLDPLTAAEKLELARLCQDAEHRFVGVHCGPLDQICSLFGRAFHAIEIDCQSFAIERVPLLGDVALVVCDSGVAHQLVAGEYNSLREHCEGAARAIGVRSLRSVDATRLAEAAPGLPQRQRECATHVVEEIRRVVAGSRALRDGDVGVFGELLSQSHESSRTLLKNSCPELDRLVELAKSHPACLGARLTGGGFGGATISLVRQPETAAFVDHMAAGYTMPDGQPLVPKVLAAADGAE